jgi:hypothetical protein
VPEAPRVIIWNICLSCCFNYEHQSGTADFSRKGRGVIGQIGQTSGHAPWTKSRKIKGFRGFSCAIGLATDRSPQNRVECRPRNEGIGHGFSRALQQFASG